MNITWAALVFVGLCALVGVLWALYLLWIERYSTESKLVEKRLQRITELSRDGQPVLLSQRKLSQYPWMQEWLQKMEWSEKLDQRLLKAGLTLTVSDYIFLSCGTALLALVFLHIAVDSALVVFIGVMIGAYLPQLFLMLAISHRQNILMEQLPDVFDFIARSMQAGHAFNASLQMAAQEAPEPIASEFILAFNQANLGMPIQKALSDLASRVDCADMRYFATAVMINKEVGGDLAGLLRGVSDLIRERLKLKLLIRAMTAEGRMSAWILGSLPLIVAAILYLINAQSIAPLWQQESGRKMVLYALGLMFAGIIWMMQLSKVRA